jgi:predicted transcriptional regulator
MKSPFFLADRYLIPSLYRLLVMNLRSRGLLEVEIAEILGISVSNVSRYLNMKRGAILRLEDLEEALKFTDELAESVIAGKRVDINFSIYKIASELLSRKLLCEFHRSIDWIDRSCNICPEIFK